jgi:hypothetical protein
VEGLQPWRLLRINHAQSILHGKVSTAPHGLWWRQGRLQDPWDGREDESAGGKATSRPGLGGELLSAAPCKPPWITTRHR